MASTDETEKEEVEPSPIFCPLQKLSKEIDQREREGEITQGLTTDHGTRGYSNHNSHTAREKS